MHRTDFVGSMMYESWLSRSLRPVRVRSHAFALAALLAGGVSTGQAQPGSPAGPVPVERLRARRQALAHRIGTGVVLLRSADERSAEPYGDYPQDTDFRQDNDFFYFTGLETAGSWLVLVARDSQLIHEMLFLPPRDSIGERWTGAKLIPGPEATTLTGIGEVQSSERAESTVRQLVGAPQSPAARGAVFFRRGERDRATDLFQSFVFDNGVPIQDLRPHVAALRLRKDPDEILRLRQAAKISVAGHLAAWAAARPGALERELEAAAEATFRRQGAERVAYPSIVGSGVNGTTLHYETNRGALGANDLVVMDMGAEYGYYASDVTRTIPASGRFTDRQRTIYELVLAAHQSALDSIRPGVPFARLNQWSHQFIRDHSGDLCRPRNCNDYYIHSLAHLVGMDVHDVGNLPGLVLEPGMVFTVEPGVYLPDEGLGVRIEDTVLVTATGYEVLSTGLPRTVAEIETWLAERRKRGGSGQ